MPDQRASPPATAPATAARPARAAPAVGGARIVVGAAVVAVIAYAYVDGARQGRVSPVDYLGYFTNLTSLLTSAILIVSAARSPTGRSAGAEPLVWMRAAAVASMLVVAVIYNVVVPGTGTAPPWVSAVLHVVFPLLVAADWLLVGDRPALPWRRLWLVLPYPLAWLVIVLVRGATDGWVPYGFLLPSHGAASLALHVACLVVVLLAAGAAVWGSSRLPGLRGLAR